MPPKAKHFAADDLLKAIYKAQGHDHYGHTQRGGPNGQANDESAKGVFIHPRYSFSYEKGYIQERLIFGIFQK